MDGKVAFKARERGGKVTITLMEHIRHDYGDCMLKRKAMDRLLFWKEHKTSQALLVDGARQVGKTYLVREFAHRNYASFAELNFVEQPDAARAVSAAANADEAFARISAFVEGELVPGQTLVFLDEVQECPRVRTTIKFLVERYPEYDWVLSGSLLGIEMQNVESVPVGYLDSIQMYPLDFEEFCWACGLAPSVIDAAREAFERSEPIDAFVHERLLGLFHEYLVVGGMPAAVQLYVDEHNIQSVRSVQQNIVARYREDISKYAGGRAHTVKRIFDLMPSELSQQNKRFIISDAVGKASFNRYENDFLWLVDAGVALPVYNVDEPRPPLAISQNSSLFKLFMSDVGLLACLCGMDVTRDMLAGRRDVLYGAIYENAVAQELAAHGFSLYYFKNKSMGELDFVIEHPRMTVLPLEVKSGKTYKRHSALTNVLATENYGIERALVLCEGNLEVEGKVTYAPIYCVAFLEDE